MTLGAQPSADPRVKQELSRTAQLDRIYTYHESLPDQVPKYQAIRAKAKELAVLVDTLCPTSREQSLAFTKIEEAVMWANASIARE